MKKIYYFLLISVCLICVSCATVRPEPYTPRPWGGGGVGEGGGYTGEITYHEPPTSSGTTTESPQPASNQSGVVDCRCKGIPLYGKVQVVTSSATFKVLVTTSSADLDVEVVTSSPNNCGQWEFVTSSPDFTVEFVTSSPDFSITYVTSSPGAN